MAARAGLHGPIATGEGVTPFFACRKWATNLQIGSKLRFYTNGVVILKQF
jgi:hypothetical protein